MDGVNTCAFILCSEYKRDHVTKNKPIRRIWSKQTVNKIYYIVYKVYMLYKSILKPYRQRTFLPLFSKSQDHFGFLKVR
jgi:hypothetical protein